MRWGDVVRLHYRGRLRGERSKLKLGAAFGEEFDSSYGPPPPPQY